MLQTVPRYVAEGEPFEIELRVEKTLQTPSVSFEYELLDGLFPVTNGPGYSADGRIRFDAPSGGTADDCTLRWTVKATGRAGDKGDFGPKPGSAVLTIGDRRVLAESARPQSIEIVADVEEKLWETYAARSMDEAISTPAEPAVVLAKISLLQMGPSYVIDHVTPSPYDELIANSPLLARLSQRKSVSAPSGSGPVLTVGTTVRNLGPQEPPQFSADYKAGAGRLDLTLGLPQPKSARDEVGDGTVDIPLVGGISRSGIISFGKQERSYYTEEISHGLGPGQVLVTVGLESADGDMISDLLNVNESVFYGASDVFQGSEFDAGLPRVSIGTIVYPRKGTFRIGLKLLSAAEAPSLRMRWWAVRNSREADHAEAEAGLTSSEQEAAAGTDRK
ncbi:hypothetical protein LJK88_26845 [Paenibacillus sp. P26]|nr:hypothetical protein LJK88_26845 [Paenibacillus sp. P26]